MITEISENISAVDLQHDKCKIRIRLTRYYLRNLFGNLDILHLPNGLFEQDWRYMYKELTGPDGVKKEKKLHLVPIKANIWN